MTPFDQYRQIRDQQMDWVPRHPFVNIYQPLEALRALKAFPDRSYAKRLAPHQNESGEAPLCSDMSFPAGRFPNTAVSCQLALLWADLAVQTGDSDLGIAAKRLAGFLCPIIEQRFGTLWASQRDYDEEETAVSFSLLMRALGKPYDEVRLKSISEDGLFFYLFQRNIQIERGDEVVSDPELGYQLFKEENAAWAITSKGFQTPAGALRIGDVEIPAFGPHGYPLNDPLHFGIGPGDQHWFSSFAAKETWFRIEPVGLGPGEISFTLHSAGVSVEKPISFAFFVRAEECKIGGHTYKPNSLQRFSNTADKVEFTALQTNIILTISQPLKMEVIPLSGESAYWGSTFLLVINLSPFHTKTHFIIK